ncbi:concanavalin A-like lectin/glucanase [Hesseltinella vesiculosa]|uniref:Concanavalin A-like lectin/glucanase n=1 Tax=Hesseltinella vesiculosa TaxID=101127 RepID=A0A1X2G720_9FUNG|nr:concanavalin A-like lectin/glucanase [Hesseltinella vesiculosa]
MDYHVHRKNQGDFDRQFDKSHVKMSPDGAQILVSKSVTTNGKIISGSFGTTRKDILFGTFRSSLRPPAIPGTVSSFYYYRNDSAEIDMELLSRFTDPHKVYFAIHPQIYNPNGAASNLTQDKHPLTFDPTSAIHEYRFDWLPDQVQFYVDGQNYRTLSTNVPNSPGRVLFNHWSDGNPNFSGDPPSDLDIYFLIANATFFFNTTQQPTLSCQSRQLPCLVSDIMAKNLVPKSELPLTAVSRANAASIPFHSLALCVASFMVFLA